MEELEAKLDDLKADVQGSLLEFNLGNEGEHKPIYVSQLLDPKITAKLIIILRTYKDCFVWEYSEMPGLANKLLEHYLPVREGHRPFKQTSKRMSLKLLLK